MTARSSTCSVSAKFFPMLVETPYFWGVIDPKIYLNHDLGSNFFFLSSLAYKLVNLLVFEKMSCKMSKNWSFIKIIGRGLNFTYEFEVCYRQICLSTSLHLGDEQICLFFSFLFVQAKKNSFFFKVSDLKKRCLNCLKEDRIQNYEKNLIVQKVVLSTQIHASINM